MNIKNFTAAGMTVVSLLGAVATPALAVTPTSPATMRQEARQEAKEKREAAITRMAQKRSDLLEKHCAKVEENLTNIIGRVETRISKQKEQGKDVSSAETAVADAKSSLSSGKSLCDQAVAKFNAVPKDKWSEQQPVLVEARGLAKQAREVFAQARKAIGKAIAALARNKKAETSSPSTNQ